MTLKAVAGGQINNAKMLTDEAAPKNKTAQSAFNPTATVPLTADKQFGANFLGNLNRARLEQKFAAQQPQQNPPVQNDENKEILGVNTKRPFPKAIAPDETQESVLRRTFQEYAATAGISNEKAEGVDKSPAEMFVEERMEANKAENKGEYRIFNSKTGAAYTDKEWVDFQKSGGITMYPTEVDIDSLKSFKSVSDTNLGQKTAGEVLEAMKEGADSPRLARALETMRAYQNNADFQSGLVDQMGADKFLELHAMVKDDLTYRAVLQQTLSGATSLEPEYAEGVEHDTSIGQRIAQKADVETLAQLTSSESHPMSRDFLVEAGKRVMTQDVGWTTRGGGEMGVAVKYNIYNAGTKELLQAIAKNPNASLELLQNADFVKNGLKLENSGENEDTISQIIRSGMSKDMQANNGEKLDNALRIIIEAAKEPNDIKGTSKSGLRESPETVSERTAITLAEVYQNNIESFTAATGHSRNRTDNFGVDDARTLLKVIQPYSAVKDANGITLGDRIAATTAVKYMDLLAKAESTGNLKYAEQAANVVGAYVDAKNQSNLAEAKEAEARREQLGKILGMISELTIVHGAEGAASKILIDAAGKMAASATEGSVKGNDIDDAVKQNRATLENQQATNKISLVQVYEQAAFERVSGARPATADEKARAQQLLNDLKEYNESLPPSAKILDANGRLINPAKMRGRQSDSMEDILSGKTNSAGDRLSNQMQATYDKLTLRTEVQIKN